MLIIFGGLPGVGKTAIAVELARVTGAVHLRIDSIEQAIRTSGSGKRPLDDAGYRVAYAVAEDNLRIGRTVIADSVNPLRVTREAWAAVANRAGVRAVEIEVECSDVDEHQRRVESRISDIPGFELPTWGDVAGREYHPWDGEHLVIDTAGRSVAQNVDFICRCCVRGREASSETRRGTQGACATVFRPCRLQWLAKVDRPRTAMVCPTGLR